MPGWRFLTAQESSCDEAGPESEDWKEGYLIADRPSPGSNHCRAERRAVPTQVLPMTSKVKTAPHPQRRCVPCRFAYVESKLTFTAQRARSYFCPMSSISTTSRVWTPRLKTSSLPSGDQSKPITTRPWKCVIWCSAPLFNWKLHMSSPSFPRLTYVNWRPFGLQRVPAANETESGIGNNFRGCPPLIPMIAM